jgi:nucleoside-diphosphate-sugar epimerase
MRIFVAGATGAVGRPLVPLLVAAGHAVTAVGRTPAKRAALAGAGATGVEVDLFDPAALRQAVAGHEAVLNLATHIPPAMKMMWPGAWRENDRIRREGAANLADAALAARAEIFVQESFGLIYEDQADRWVDESCPVRPASHSASALDAEASAARVTAAGASGVVLRFAGFYGAGSGQTADLVGAVRRGLAPLPGPPDRYMSAITTDDAAAAVVAVLAARPAPGIYNVVDDEPLTHRAHIDALAAALGVAAPRLPPARLTPLMGAVGDTLSRSIRLSNAKLRGSTGWAPRYPSAREGWPMVVGQLAAVLSSAPTRDDP